MHVFYMHTMYIIADHHIVGTDAVSAHVVECIWAIMECNPASP